MTHLRVIPFNSLLCLGFVGLLGSARSYFPSRFRCLGPFFLESTSSVILRQPSVTNKRGGGLLPKVHTAAASHLLGVDESPECACRGVGDAASQRPPLIPVTRQLASSACHNRGELTSTLGAKSHVPRYTAWPQLREVRCGATALLEP